MHRGVMRFPTPHPVDSAVVARARASAVNTRLKLGIGIPLVPERNPRGHHAACQWGPHSGNVRGSR